MWKNFSWEPGNAMCDEKSVLYLQLHCGNPHADVLGLENVLRERKKKSINSCPTKSYFCPFKNIQISSLNVKYNIKNIATLLIESEI